MNDEIHNRKLGRRRLLRRAGTVAAGVAGAGMAGAVAATPAQAASGSFDSASLTTPGVTVTNTATGAEAAGIGIGPQLRLVPTTGDIISQAAPVGSLAMDGDGFIWATTGQGTNGPYRDFLHTTGNSSSTWPITPTRILDTRSAAGRVHVINQSGTFQSSGKLKAGHWIHLDLTSLVQYGYAVIANITAVDPNGVGYMSVVPYGAVDYTQPLSTSNILYNTGNYIANMVFCGIGSINGGSTDVVSIYSWAESHLILDVFGFVVDSSGRIVSYRTSSVQGAKAATAQSLAAQRREFVAQAPPM